MAYPAAETTTETAVPLPSEMLSEGAKADAQELFERLKKSAKGLERRYIEARIPAELQAYFDELNPPEDPEDPEEDAAPPPPVEPAP